MTNYVCAHHTLNLQLLKTNIHSNLRVRWMYIECIQKTIYIPIYKNYYMCEMVTIPIHYWNIFTLTILCKCIGMYTSICYIVYSHHKDIYCTFMHFVIHSCIIEFDVTSWWSIIKRMDMLVKQEFLIFNLVSIRGMFILCAMLFFFYFVYILVKPEAFCNENKLYHQWQFKVY